mmetsp:Transcript_20236/g.37755  ORF Transcript_20236/g.37755 Transcript_20236/m.37755 type:complete len:195 (+) Transcript_20236:6781-7365(+)
MLRLFQKYSRLLALHPIFSNRDLFLKVLEYLNGKDLAEAVVVCFHWKSTILSEPSLEVRILRYKLREAHQTIEELHVRIANPQSRQYTNRPLPSFVPPKLTEQSVKDSRANKVQKWLNFVDLFHYFAYRKDFTLKKRTDFKDSESWQMYQDNFKSFYNEFLDYFKVVRQQQEQRPRLPGLLSWFNLKLSKSRSQ